MLRGKSPRPLRGFQPSAIGQAGADAIAVARDHANERRHVVHCPQSRTHRFIASSRPSICGQCQGGGLFALRIGSALTFAADAFSVLRLVGAPIVRGTKAYREVEHLGQACNCSCRLHDNAGTITFYR
jgi:hypothetical protein